MPGRAGQGGFTYLTLIFAVALFGVLLAGAGQVWHTAAQREKEAELLFVGNQYRQALTSYYERTPVGSERHPERLEELLEDARFPMPVRHLRRLYADPFTGLADWELQRVGGRITGVHSRAPGRPLKIAFDEADAAFAGSESYAQWVFAVLPPAPPAAATAAAQ
jgi:type II secretory pathway pseudopilin PulG